MTTTVGTDPYSDMNGPPEWTVLGENNAVYTL